MSYNNYGSQNGDGGLNVGTGDFRGANINIRGNEKSTFTPEQLNIARHPVIGGRIVKSENLNIFGIITGAASVIGLYFTLFQAFPHPKQSSWSNLFLFLFAMAIFFVALSFGLKKRKFGHFLFNRYYLELGNRGGLYINKFTATCPWCRSNMNLRNVGPKNGHRDDLFICERNPEHHKILLDPTVLSEINEMA